MGTLANGMHPPIIHRRIVSPGKSVTIAIMLMHGASPRVPLPPRRDAAPVETAEALEPCHRNAHLKLFQADGAFRRVYAVLFCRDIGEHASRTWRYPGQRSTVWASFIFGTPSAWRAAVGAVRGDAHADVRLTERLKVGKISGRELTVAHWALILLGNLRNGWRQRGQAAVHPRRRAGVRWACPARGLSEEAVERGARHRHVPLLLGGQEPGGQVSRWRAADDGWRATVLRSRLMRGGGCCGLLLGSYSACAWSDREERG